MLQEWIGAHKGKKDAQDAEIKRKQDIRDAVEPAVAAYEEAKKKLKTAGSDRRAAVKAANDPPSAVRGVPDVSVKLLLLRRPLLLLLLSVGLCS